MKRVCATCATTQKTGGTHHNNPVPLGERPLCHVCHLCHRKRGRNVEITPILNLRTPPNSSQTAEVNTARMVTKSHVAAAIAEAMQDLQQSK